MKGFTMTKQEELEYWSQKLLAVSDDTYMIKQEWHAKHQLDIVEQYKAMSLLLDVHAYSTLLAEALAKPEPKRSLWTKLRHK